jgi:hypothetical protein
MLLLAGCNDEQPMPTQTSEMRITVAKYGDFVIRHLSAQTSSQYGRRFNLIYADPLAIRMRC